jgi:hypothetical protein
MVAERWSTASVLQPRVQPLRVRCRLYGSAHRIPFCFEQSQVEEIYNKITSILYLVDPHNSPPDLPDLANCLFQALGPELREKTVDLLADLVPLAQPATWPQQMSRLRQFMEAAAKKEQEIRADIKMIDNRLNFYQRSATRRHINPPPPHTHARQYICHRARLPRPTSGPR